MDRLSVLGDGSVAYKTQWRTKVTVLAVITKQDVILRILSNVKVPRCPVSTEQAQPLYYDVTGEPVPRWALGVDPDPDERGAPIDYDVVDPPALDECSKAR